MSNSTKSKSGFVAADKSKSLVADIIPVVVGVEGSVSKLSIESGEKAADFKTPSKSSASRRAKKEIFPEDVVDISTFQRNALVASSKLEMEAPKVVSFSKVAWLVDRLLLELYWNAGGVQPMYHLVAQSMHPILSMVLKKIAGLDLSQTDLSDSRLMKEAIDMHWGVAKILPSQIPSLLSAIVMVASEVFSAELITLYLQDFTNNLAKFRVIEDKKATDKELVQHLVKGLMPLAFRKLIEGRPSVTFLAAIQAILDGLELMEQVAIAVSYGLVMFPPETAAGMQVKRVMELDNDEGDEPMEGKRAAKVVTNNLTAAVPAGVVVLLRTKNGTVLACNNCSGNHYISVCGEPCVACAAAVASGTVLKHVGAKCPIYCRSVKKANKASKKNLGLKDMVFSDDDDSSED